MPDNTYGPGKPASEYLTLWDYLEINELQEQALLSYMREHCVTVEQAITRLAVEGLAIDAMCPEISEP